MIDTVIITTSEVSAKISNIPQKKKIDQYQNHKSSENQTKYHINILVKFNTTDYIFCLAAYQHTPVTVEASLE